MAKYMGLAKLQSQFKNQPGITNPGGLAAFIGRKKYGKTKFQSFAAKGKKMRGVVPMSGRAANAYGRTMGGMA